MGTRIAVSFKADSFILVSSRNKKANTHTHTYTNMNISTPPGYMTRGGKVEGQRGRAANWGSKHISPGGYSYTHTDSSPSSLLCLYLKHSVIRC